MFSTSSSSSGADPATEWLRGCDVVLDAKGFVKTGADLSLEELVRAGRRDVPRPLETSVPGVFAIGDVRCGSVKRVGGASAKARSWWCSSTPISRTSPERVDPNPGPGARGSGFNATCSGSVRTGMGGRHAPRSVEEGAASVLFGAMVPEEGPTGKVFRDGRETAP